jgi:hypothetical protein
MPIPAILEQEFSAWVTAALDQPIPLDTIAFHFNLYEGLDSVHVQLIGARSFSVGDQQWPCDETFTTGEDIFEVPYQFVGAEWPEWLESMKTVVQAYLASGTKSARLRASHGIGIGFVDGDVHVLWTPPN